MKYAFIAAHEEQFSVKRMCHAVGVQRSGYYAWKRRPVSAREKANTDLLEKIREVFEMSRETYGSLRIQRYFLRQGYSYSRHRVARLMKRAHIVPIRVAKWHPQAKRQCSGARIAPNLLNQDFTADKPNEKWVGDITYINTAEGWLYLAAILDLYSRCIVGWAIADRVDSHLVEKAWEMALINRHQPTHVLHHTDRGSQYTSEVYLNLLEVSHCRLSMSRAGNCFDNAAMESFFATLKGECAYKQFRTKYEARLSIFEFIEVWYNRQRLHSTLG
ncbi:MAG: IS3 family transposase, partial [Anaerolineaceae bacterium]